MGKDATYERDIVKAKLAERILFDVINDELGLVYDVEYTADVPAYYNRGDVLIRNYNKDEWCIDAKDDKSIWHTHNVFVEERIARGYYTEKGWITKNYDEVAIVNRHDNEIYILDFKKLKEEYKRIRHRCNVPARFHDHTSYGSLCNIYDLQAYGIVNRILEYEGNEQDGFKIKLQEKTA